MKLKKMTIERLSRLFNEEMKAHRLYGASSFFDELMLRGYTCEFHKRRVKKND